MIGHIPTFKLYQCDNEYDITISNKKTSPIRLKQEDLDLLEKLNQSIFVDTLKFDVELDFEQSLSGGLIVILKKSNNFNV